MQKLKVQKELIDLIPEPSAEIIENLELDLIEYGCKNPIIIWGNNRILDGHKRYQICMNYNIPFRVRHSGIVDLPEAITDTCYRELRREGLTQARYRYLIGKWSLTERLIARKETQIPERRRGIGTEASLFRKYEKHIADSMEISTGAVMKYRFYANAIDTIGSASDLLAKRILNGALRISHENVIELSHRPPEEIRSLEHAVVRNSIDYLSREDIQHEIQWLRYEVQLTDSVSKRQERDTMHAEIKKMPKYDPDAEVTSLAFTIPSWCGSIDKTKNNTDFSKITQKARRRLNDQLLSLMTHINELLNKIEDE